MKKIEINITDEKFKLKQNGSTEADFLISIILMVQHYIETYKVSEKDELKEFIFNNVENVEMKKGFEVLENSNIIKLVNY